MKGETLASFGDRSGLVNHQAGDRGCLFVGKIPVHRTIEIADRHRAIDHHRAVRLGAHARNHDIVLVGDVTDDLLQNVLQRHHAFDFAVFINHQREVSLAAAECLQLLRYRAHLRHKPWRQGDGRDIDFRRIALRGANRAQEVLGVQHTDDVFRLVTPQRNSCVFGRQHLANQLLWRQVGVDHYHFSAMNHHVRNLKLA